MSEFVEFMREVEREAVAEGPEALAELSRLRDTFGRTREALRVERVHDHRQRSALSSQENRPIDKAQETIARVAEAAHEANRIYCEATGDMSQKPWKDAEQWQCDSAITGAEVALGGATSSQQHLAWYNDKLANGWRFGPVKDTEAKTHPCLVPYEELPEQQKRKDALYIAVVKAMAAALRPI